MTKMQVGSEHQQHQILHCIKRLRERYGWGPEAYYDILNTLQFGKRKRFHLWPNKAEGCCNFRLRYRGKVVVGVLDFKRWHLVTVYPLDKR